MESINNAMNIMVKQDNLRAFQLKICGDLQSMDSFSAIETALAKHKISLKHGQKFSFRMWSYCDNFSNKEFGKQVCQIANALRQNCSNGWTLNIVCRGMAFKKFVLKDLDNELNALRTDCLVQ